MLNAPSCLASSPIISSSYLQKPFTMIISESSFLLKCIDVAQHFRFCVVLSRLIWSSDLQNNTKLYVCMPYAKDIYVCDLNLKRQRWYSVYVIVKSKGRQLLRVTYINCFRFTVRIFFTQVLIKGLCTRWSAWMLLEWNIWR